MSINEDQCYREKYWEELTQEEKIERVARLLDYKCNEISNLYTRINKFDRHLHHNDEIVYREPMGCIDSHKNTWVNFKPKTL